MTTPSPACVCPSGGYSLLPALIGVSCVAGVLLLVLFCKFLRRGRPGGIALAACCCRERNPVEVAQRIARALSSLDLHQLDLLMASTCTTKTPIELALIDVADTIRKVLPYVPAAVLDAVRP